MRTIIAIGILTALLSIVAISPTFAEKQQSVTETIPINDSLALEKTTLTMNIPSNNKLPFGFVEGKIKNAAVEYPVIIQIYKGKDAYHFAQTDVKKDGSYEYRFRVLDSNSDRTIKIFEGDYTVKIFKVVNLPTTIKSA
ncbi:MAG TPA: hypothetical protein VD689_03020 [Nitrosopumilaceae archaeon]|nr:hypothetical protein [Nitrosopumilaceae archaeon]